MNFGRLKTSARLQRVYQLLLPGREMSSLEITLRAKVVAVGTCISELRANGAVIDCRVETRPEGGRVWLYRMTKRASETVDA
ncbi:MAG: hypothetical protein AAFS03_02410 [Pseudomonadota bacterium]